MSRGLPWFTIPLSSQQAPKGVMLLFFGSRRGPVIGFISALDQSARLAAVMTRETGLQKTEHQASSRKNVGTAIRTPVRFRNRESN